MSRFLPPLLLLAMIIDAQVADHPKLRPPEQPNPKTLLSPSVIDSLVNELSGSIGIAHILELNPYERNRPAEVYKGLYSESAYMEKKLKEYKLDQVESKRYPMPGKQWDGEEGEFWITQPVRRQIVNYRDIPAMLAVGSQSADVTAELVYCGRGDNKSDYVGKNVAGNIALISGPPGAAANLALKEFGAAGIVSYSNPTGHPFDRPDQIAWNGLGGRVFSPAGGKTAFAFNLSHRMGIELLEMLEKGEKLTVQAKVRATEYDAPMQVSTALIEGDGSSDQEITLVAHLFEGVAKQGGMDNSSGSAMILEIARVWKKLIDDGVLTPPGAAFAFFGSRRYLAPCLISGQSRKRPNA